MKYEKIVEGKFISRPNRFIAEVALPIGTEGNVTADGQLPADVTRDGVKIKAHVKNTGRLGELLLPGAKVYLEDHEGRMGNRKLRYSLIGVEKAVENGFMTVNIDSQAPNRIVKEALASGRLILTKDGHLRLRKAGEDVNPEERSCCEERLDIEIKPEARFGDSRLDFRVTAGAFTTCGKAERAYEAYIEVKGVTLESGGIASFPDAPTERGIKHLWELERTVKEGNKAFVIFVLQMKGMKLFEPNDEKHRAFGEALRHALCSGVEALAFECEVSKDMIEPKNEIDIRL